MIAIDNSGLLTVCNVCGAAGFAPAVTYAYDSAAHTITLTDASVFAAADGLAIVQITITDGTGAQLTNKITVTATPKVIDVSSLDAFLGFNINVMVVTTNRMQGVLSQYHVGSSTPIAGSLRWSNKTQG